MIGDIAGAVVMASNVKVGKHALDRELLQQEISTSLGANQLMNEQSRLYQVIVPETAG